MKSVSYDWRGPTCTEIWVVFTAPSVPSLTGMSVEDASTGIPVEGWAMAAVAAWGGSPTALNKKFSALRGAVCAPRH